MLLKGGLSSGANRDPLFYLRTEVGFSFSTDVLHEGVRFGKSANFTQTPILNRSSPIITYANSNPLMLSVALNLFVTNGDNDEDGGPFYVIKVLESITSLTYPVQAGIQPPTVCYITLAGYSIFNEWPCVMPSFEASHGSKNIYTNSGAPMDGTVNLQFMGIELENQSVSDLISRGDYRQTAFRGISGAGTGGVSGDGTGNGNFGNPVGSFGNQTGSDVA